MLDLRKVLARSSSMPSRLYIDHSGGPSAIDLAHARGKLSPGLGRDLVEALWTGASVVVDPFDAYGDITLAGCARSPDPMLRAYAATCELVREKFQADGITIRRTGSNRVAASIIEELAKQSACPTCRAHGWISTSDGPVLCDVCEGSRIERRSMSWRADRCRYNRNDFRDRLAGPYHAALVEAAECERSAIDELGRILA